MFLATKRNIEICTSAGDLDTRFRVEGWRMGEGWRSLIKLRSVARSLSSETTCRQMMGLLIVSSRVGVEVTELRAYE
jgi:hypothetical protein